MPRRSPLLGATLLLIAGCDAFGGDGFPAPDVSWARPGAALVFDYVSGPDSLRTLIGNEAIPSTPSAATFRVETDVLGALDDGPVGMWTFAYDGPGTSPVYLGFRLPLHEDRLTTTPEGLAIVDRLTCDPYGAGPQGQFAWIRVPREPAGLTEFRCGRSAGQSLDEGPYQTVETPAGRFEAYPLEGLGGYNGASGGYDTQREYWSWEHGLVRVDLLSPEGVLRGRLVRAD
ncbi:MAG: hypothetical protein R3181_07325 [Rubricoccaceae bacterium]|nr:hypothetical protein [Rubricoccaceae bacterium]